MESDIEELLNDLEEDKNRTRERITVLVKERLDLEKDFEEGKRKKSVLWRLCLRSIKNKYSNCPFNVTEIKKKYHPPPIYRRVKRRNNQSGQSRTVWEYYDIFDEILGTQHNLNPPMEILGSTMAAGNADEGAKDSDISNISTQSTTDSSNKRRKRKKDDRSDYLNKFEENEERRHQEFINIEKGKCKIEREKCKILMDVKRILQAIINV